MKILITSALVVAGLAASMPMAFADGNPPDFAAIQRGEPYEGAAPIVGPFAQHAKPAPAVHRTVVHHAALHRHIRGVSEVH